jgi:hypothetical protein
VGNFTQDATLQGALVNFRGGFASILRKTAHGLKGD